MPNNIDQAPIIFLLGTSTAGKTTICKEIEKQTAQMPHLKNKIEKWGHDNESEKLFNQLGVDMLQHDTRFQAISHLPVKESLTAIYYGSLTDSLSNKTLSFEEEKFQTSLDQFLQDTNHRYERETLLHLKGLAQDEMQTHAYQNAVIDLAHQTAKITKSTIDHAIENSHTGIATILDGVPLGFMDERQPTTDHRIIEKLERYLEEKGFTGPTQVALVHLHPTEMALRMQQRNNNADAAGGDKGDRRDHLGYYEAQYSQLFGKKTHDGELLHPTQELRRDDIEGIVEKFGAIKINDEEVRIRDIKEHERSDDVKDAIKQKTQNVMDAIGFAQGEDVLTIGSKIKADVMFDHQQQSSTDIASTIVDFISQHMPPEKPKAKEAEDILPTKKSWVDMINDERKAKDDSQILR